ncbi:MAG: protein kinase domain-containing protein [Planctomycetota bacterium]|jgi:serine/threonine protein kinase
MAAKSHCPDASDLKAMLNGAVSEDRQTDLAEHLEQCGACREEFERLARGAEGLPCPTSELGRTPNGASETAVKRLVEDLRASGHDTAASHGGTSDDLSLDFLGPPENADHLGRLESYEITKIVGRGGMGVVLQAHDTRLNRCVAIKVLAPELAANATARKRFLREAQAAAAVSHDHVVTIHAVDEAAEPPFLVMEFIDGISLDERIQCGGPLELKEILRIGMQTASGLAAAHAQGLAHRDVKPSNILLENGVERVKITDFGLARAADDVHFTRPGAIAGTPQYMSPEQARGEPVDHRSDLFSLGCVLYAMCTGRSPFRAETLLDAIRRVCDDAPRPIQQVNADVPDWLFEIIDRLLEKDREARFQSAAELADLLGGHLAHLQQPAAVPKPSRLTPAAEPSRRPPSRRRRPVLAAAAVVVLLLLGVTLTDATGVTNVGEFVATVLRINTPQGTLVVTVVDPDIDVTIDGKEVTFRNVGPHEISLKPGKYRIQGIKDGVPFQDQRIEIFRGGRLMVKVEPPTSRGAESVAQLPPNAIDLMPLMDPARDAVDPGWKRQEGALVTWGLYWPTMQIPYLLPEEYDIVATVKRASGEKAFCMSLPVQGKRCWAVIDWVFQGGCVSGVRTFKPGALVSVHDGYHGRLLPLGEKTTIHCAVRREDSMSSIHVTCGGTTAFHWRGNVDELIEADSGFRPADRFAALFVSGEEGVFHVTELAVVPVSDGGRPLFADGSVGPDRRVAEQVCWTGGTVWVSVDGGEPAKIDRFGQLPPSLSLKQVQVKHPSGLLQSDFSLEGLTGLEKLSLRGQHKLPASVLNGLAGCRSLRELDLSFTGVTDEELPILKKLTGLRNLALTGTQISDVGCAHLGELEQLEELDVCGTRISNEGVKSLRRLQRLRQLRLEETSIDDGAVTQLRDLPRLSSLSLAHTAVSDEGLAILEQWDSLSHVSVIGTQVTPEGLHKLGLSLPNCEIERDAGSRVNLLDGIDPKRDSVRGAWEWNGEVLASPVLDHASLQIPHVPPEEYSLEADVVRESGGNAIWLGIVLDDRQTALHIGGWPSDGYPTGLDCLDGATARKNETTVYGRLISNGENVTIRVTVRKGQITAKCGDRLIVDWTGDPSRLSLFGRRSVPKTNTLSVGAFKSRYRISQMQLTPIARTGPSSTEAQE